MIMEQPIVECIPNFSEGRRTEVVEEIQAAIAAVQGVHVLDRHMDADHNRSVITFAGQPEGVLEAAYAAIARAAQLIDLDQHEGEHPRIGATDVVPFVPIQGVTMDECVELARRLGHRVGETLRIPVYLYEFAASRPDRVNLADIRKGEYEGLKAEITNNPDRLPDFGPANVGSAGAVVIGARVPLIAYNVYLTTDDVGIADEIARAVRHSSGGLRYVKALGMLVDGRAQVSMNLTDYTRTPIARVVELIRGEARRHGVAVHHSELVGLIPQAGLIEAARWHLQLDQFKPEQILENRLFEAIRADKPGGDAFLEALASSEPTPGGGSAAAYAGAMAAGLVAMVARVTIGKKKYAQVEKRMKEIASEADDLRQTLAEGVGRDARAFEAVMEAYRLPKKTEEEQAARVSAIEGATAYAAQVPLEACRLAVQVLALAREAGATGNVNAVSDAGSAGAMARACLTAAAMNVRINAISLKERAQAEAWLAELKALETEAEEHERALVEAIKERGGI
jgi:glutamate formiminotransferase/formiminotetrahydrofolate cyclodeaminase